MKDLFNKQVDSVAYDNLMAGFPGVDIQTKSVTLKANTGIVKRGTVLGIITAGALAVAVDSTKADGSQKSDCILTEDTDTTGGNAVAVAYSAGTFNRKALTFGGTDAAALHEDTLRNAGIFLKDNIPY